MTPPVLLVQHVSFEWGPAGRSAVMTARRRDLPRHYPLPRAVPEGAIALSHTVSWTDEDAFTHAHEAVQAFDHFTTSPTQPVTVTGTAQLATLPPRSMTGLDDHPLRLRVGQTARFEWNEPLPGTGERQRHSIVNVALWTRPCPADLFQRLPDLYRSHMIRLHARLSR